MKIHIVELSREAYAEIFAQLPPASRYVALGLFPSPHCWLRDDQQNVIVLTPKPITA